MTRLPLSQALATPDDKRRYNQHLFTTIAPRYDLITRVLSYGQDQRWKAWLIRLAGVRPGEWALDVACGTGDLTLRLRAAGASVVGLDLTPAMLRHARARGDADRLRYVAGDACRLPFAPAVFDLVTAGYALRNLPDLDEGLRELARVLRPGGRMLALDFNRPRPGWLRGLYHAYLWLSGSVLGLLLHANPDVYRYISASLKRHPDAEELTRRFHEAGFARAGWHPVLGGLMALFVAHRRAEGAAGGDVPPPAPLGVVQ
jgi:demethylmenaquinone methyltransferase/2-methoxy-6-polyprenyl-1,4-benzoquinol methylase